MNMHKGAWPAMVTPYDDALRIDRGAYAALVGWYIAHGVGGLYANCLTSEMYLQDDAERLLLVRDAVTTAAGRVPVRGHRQPRRHDRGAHRALPARGGRGRRCGHAGRPGVLR